jgi:hypothetical protein
MSNRPGKTLVYVIVDGMSVEALEQAIGSGRAPALAFLKDHSTYVRDGVAVFPTITPAATASLVTGQTPARHGIPGMCWYDRSAQRFVNYGQSPRAAVVEGLSQIVKDALTNLNCEHLSPDVETLHEAVHRLGLVSASINFMIFRGPFEHRLNPNMFERLLFRRNLPKSLPGPKEHYFADVLKGPADGCSPDLPKRGVEKRMHATDGWAACVTRGLLEKRSADVVLFYLHENDHQSHRLGPQSQVDNLVQADEHLAYVLETHGSWEATLARTEFVVTADHSQSPISDQDDHILDLSEILGDFSQVRPAKGKEPFENNDLAAAGNGRVGFIYLNENRVRDLRAPVVRTLLEERGVDQVMWKEDDRYVVESRRGSFNFREAESGGVIDERDNKWEFSGELAAVSGVVEDARIRTPEYPLALWRIKEALDLDRVGDVVVTTNLTYELKDLGGGHHQGGGDHASLHVQDSIIPFMSTLPDVPAHPSTVDVMPHIMSYLERA